MVEYMMHVVVVVYVIWAMEVECVCVKFIACHVEDSQCLRVHNLCL
jgi:hypothetical protein